MSPTPQQGTAFGTSRLLLVDGHSMAFRAFFALPVENFSTSTGQVTNAVYGFFSMLINALRDEQPDHVAVAFDVSDHTFRTDEYQGYKATRSATPTEFLGQISLIKEVLTALRIPYLEKEGYEADDILATLARRGRDAGLQVLVSSGDRDTFQLVCEQVTVLYPVRGVSELTRVTPEVVLTKYGVGPERYSDLAALVGESSDNLTGVPGVGPKTAAKWITAYGDLDGIIANAGSLTGKAGQSLRDHLADVIRNRRLNQLVDDLDLPLGVEDLRRRSWDREEVHRVFDGLEFRTLRERLFAQLSAPEPEAEGGFDLEGTVLDGTTAADWLAEHARAASGVHVVGSWARGRGDALGIAVASADGSAAYLDLTTADPAATDAVATWLKDRGAGTEAVSAAVLCRKRSQFRPVMEALEARGVPFEVVGLGGLLLTPEVEDVVALLSVVDDPTRGDHLMRLLLGPIVRLGAADLDGLWTYARERQRIHAPRDGEAVKDQALDVVDTATLAEALEDLPRPGWTGPRGQTISRTALERLAVLAGMIREMRSLAAAPLPDLIAAAEQVLGLDIEVAARPGYYLSAARAHLDAFVDVAAEFSASADRVSLGAFLAWLEAAEHHERGLETRASDSAAGPVSIMTIHAAKGLEWDVVAVPGLVEATFPTHRSQPSGKSGRWTIGSQTGKGWLGSVTEAGIPHALRGDRAGLPDLDWRSLRDSVEAANAWQEFCEAMGEHAMEEERRLAYVAFTRAKEQLLLTCSVWGPQKSPRVTSRFLVDALAGAGLLEADPEERWRRLDEGRLPLGAADAGVTVLRWEPMPPVEEFVKPERTSERAAVWPVEGPSESAAYERRELAAAAIVQAMAAEPWQGVAPDDETRVLTERILRQQTQERRPSEQLPALEAISASNVVAAARSPQAFAASLRRPMPTAPNPAARRGTRFHAFVEQHFGRAAMLDWDELPGSADAEDHGGEEAALATMKAHFLASEWADRAPVAIETPVETVLPTVHGPVAVRGRIDAVFERPGGGVTIVDWKSGAPGAEGDLAARAVQLGVYALAWERIHRLAPGSVDVAFYFAATGETVRPPLPTQEQIVHVLDSIQAQHSR